ncbi:hypothetical protein HA402_002775 [Bradysia odoriphaga]|nr:hypothetical protein HA402_002775 [Bradysia odoriphaga]
MSGTSGTTRKAKKTKSSKAGLLLSVERMRQQMAKGNYATHIQTKSAVFMAAVLEYLCAEVFDIAHTEAIKAKKQRINPRHLMLAVRKDAELNELLKSVTISEGGVLPTVSVSKAAETVHSEEF